MSNMSLRMPGRWTEAMLWGLSGVSAVGLIWTGITNEELIGFGHHVDRLSTTLALLVTLVGTVTFRFARRYLLGEPGQVRFLFWHALAVVSAMLLMLSGNLILLWATWMLTGLGLHKLLTHYADRPEALPPARKKFLISRLGDVALISAILIVAIGYGTTDLGLFLSQAMQNPQTSGVQTVGVLVVIAALTKSAQFPFHSWLPETMEAPTPVSALMHAGIINAGGALLLKFAPVISITPVAVILLISVGVFTAILGMVSMWAQTNIKRTLAWSTVSQMGFMMIQLGLCVFPAAVLHIVGHGLYKAWNFLASGWVPAQNVFRPLPPGKHLSWVVIGTTFATVCLGASAWMIGLDVMHHPGEVALMVVLALALAQVWPVVMSYPTVKRALVTVFITLGVSVLAVGMYRGAMVFYAPAFEQVVVPSGVLGWIGGASVVVSVVLLILMHAFLAVLSRSPRGRAFRIHALHGFYCGAVADRVVRMVYSSPLIPGVKSHA